MKRLTFRVTICLLCLSLLVLSPVAAGPAGPSTVPISPQPSRLNLAFGNPTEATAQVTNGNNFLMIKSQFALSYNNSKGGPNWVSWHLEDGDVGAAQRLDRFHPDDQLPLGFKRIVTGLYTNTGYERGHLCNSEDRTKTAVDNLATFAMTNILPQKEDNNKGPWFALEKFGRKLVSQGNELYIVAGAFGTKGSFGPTDRKVNIPRVFWKIIVVLPRGNNDLNRINRNTRTLAVCMPNLNGIRSHDWRRYVATIRDVERATGYNFLSELSSNIQNSLETVRDFEATNRNNPCQ